VNVQIISTLSSDLNINRLM